MLQEREAIFIDFDFDHVTRNKKNYVFYWGYEVSFFQTTAFCNMGTSFCLWKKNYFQVIQSPP